MLRSVALESFHRRHWRNASAYGWAAVPIALLMVLTSCVGSRGISLPDLLDPGVYPVGFELDSLTVDGIVVDESATDIAVQFAIWYPAAKSGSRSLRVRDYLTLDAWATEGKDNSPAVISAFFQQLEERKVEHGVTRSDFADLMAIETMSSREVVAADGEFPLVYIAQGGRGGLSEQFIWAEYLASHGYIVVSTPHSGLIWPEVKENINLQLPIMEAAIKKAKAVPGVDAEKIGLHGYSQGGVCIILHQSRHDVADALLVFDGWDGWDSGVEYVSENIEGRLDEIGAPYAYLAEDPELVKRYGSSPKSFDHSNVRILAGLEDGLLVYFRGLRHLDFTSDGITEFLAPGYSYSTWQEEVRVPSADHVALVFKFGRLFFDYTLRDSAEAAEAICTLADKNALERGSVTYGPNALCQQPASD